MTASDTSAAERLRIVVLGYVVRGPIGGMTWSHLQFLLGLRGLGHDVHFFEDSDDYPSCFDPVLGYTDVDPTYGLAYADRELGRIGFGDRWAYFDAHTTTWHGPGAARRDDVLRDADLLLNLGDVNPLRPWFAGIPARAVLDQDPVFNQIRYATDAQARARVAGHTAFFTFAERIGEPDCDVPDDGLPWRPVRHPVWLDGVPPSPGRPRGAFTTVMQWESYARAALAGRRYGMKAETFLEYLDLPATSGRRFELVIGGGATPAELLRSNGWTLRDPRVDARDPSSYERFIRDSKAEWSVAKEGYVATRSGWFSERSALYLATGRPVVLQDTGFPDRLPVGSGLLSFRTRDEALAAIEGVDARYDDHCRSARDVAASCFDARLVLPPMLEAALAPAPARGPAA